MSEPTKPSIEQLRQDVTTLQEGDAPSIAPRERLEAALGELATLRVIWGQVKPLLEALRDYDIRAGDYPGQWICDFCPLPIDDAGYQTHAADCPVRVALHLLVVSERGQEK